MEYGVCGKEKDGSCGPTRLFHRQNTGYGSSIKRRYQKMEAQIMSCFFHSMHLPWLSSHKCHTQGSRTLMSSVQVVIYNSSRWDLSNSHVSFPNSHSNTLKRIGWLDSVCWAGRSRHLAFLNCLDLSSRVLMDPFVRHTLSVCRTKEKQRHTLPNHQLRVLLKAPRKF